MGLGPHLRRAFRSVQRHRPGLRAVWRVMAPVRCLRGAHQPPRPPGPGEGRGVHNLVGQTLRDEGHAFVYPPVLNQFRLEHHALYPFRRPGTSFVLVDLDVLCACSRPRRRAAAHRQPCVSNHPLCSLPYLRSACPVHATTLQSMNRTPLGIQLVSHSARSLASARRRSNIEISVETRIANAVQ